MYLGGDVGFMRDLKAKRAMVKIIEAVGAEV